MTYNLSNHVVINTRRLIIETRKYRIVVVESMETSRIRRQNLSIKVINNIR